jgi:hypothetical protein
MKFRKLRTAWSVGWGLLAVLLIVLWVRSVERWERVYLGISKSIGINLQSGNGQVKLVYTDLDGRAVCHVSKVGLLHRSKSDLSNA